MVKHQSRLKCLPALTLSTKSVDKKKIQHIDNHKNFHIQALLRKYDQSDDGKRMKKKASAIYLSTRYGCTNGHTHLSHKK